MSKKSLYIIKTLIIFAVYFVTAKFGLKLDPVSGFATLVWLPTGISLAALLILGSKFWPAIALGAFFANLTTDAPLLVAAGISLGNTLEAIIGSYLLKKIGFRNSLERLKDVLGLIILAALVSTLISATLGTTSLWVGQVINLSDYSKTWFAWWVGDMVSNLVIAPLILVWSTKLNIRIKLSWRQFFETTALFLSLLVLTVFIYPNFFNLGTSSSPRSYIIFPILIWAALRFGTLGAVSVTFLESILSVWITSLGFGPFATGSLNQNLLSVQAYMAVISVSALILAAIANEKKELEERKDEFISIASHELKTPITTIKGYTQLLNQFLKESKDKKPLIYISKMDDQLDRLTKLVNDLLDVSKIQAGKLELHKEKVDLKGLIEGVAADMSLVDHHKVTAEIDSKELIVWVDKYHISTVLVNLISNAIKYSPKSNKVIVKTTNNKDNVVIKVEDFGIGISKRDQEKIFKKFFRADNRIRQSFSGLGLGLYIAWEIVKQHQGSIWVESIKGNGTSFYFKLPKNRIKYG